MSVTKFVVGDSVLCMEGVMIYDAKVKDIKTEGRRLLYGIHYKGWNKSWDEYVEEDRLLEVTDQNRERQRLLEDEVKRKKKSSVQKRLVKKVGTDSDNSSREGSKEREITTKSVSVRIEKLKKDKESGDYVGPVEEEEEKQVVTSRTRTIKPVTVFKATEVPKSMKKKAKKEKEREKESPTANKVKSSKPAVVPAQSTPQGLVSQREFGAEIVIELPDDLKTVLVDDLDYLDRQRKLVNIPARYSLDDLISDYCQSRETDSLGRPGREEVCGGLRDYFNCTLGTQLLYKFERVQYADTLREHPNTTLSSLYGPVHLLRLLTRLGPMLTCSDIQDDELEKLIVHIQDLVLYLQDRKEELFLVSDYGTASPEYHRRAL